MNATVVGTAVDGEEVVGEVVGDLVREGALVGVPGRDNVGPLVGPLVTKGIFYT